MTLSLEQANRIIDVALQTSREAGYKPMAWWCWMTVGRW